MGFTGERSWFLSSAFAAAREKALKMSLSSLTMGFNSAWSPIDLGPGTGDQGGVAFALSAKRDNADAFHAAQQPTAATSLQFEVTSAMLGVLASRSLAGALVIPVVDPDATTPTPPTGVSVGVTLESGTVGGLTYWYSEDASGTTVGTTTTYTVGLTGLGVDYADLDDLILVLVLV